MLHPDYWSDSDGLSIHDMQCGKEISGGVQVRVRLSHIYMNGWGGVTHIGHPGYGVQDLPLLL